MCNELPGRYGSDRKWVLVWVCRVRASSALCLLSRAQRVYFASSQWRKESAMVRSVLHSADA